MHISDLEPNYLAWLGFKSRPTGNPLKSNAHCVKPPGQAYFTVK